MARMPALGKVTDIKLNGGVLAYLRKPSFSISAR